MTERGVEEAGGVEVRIHTDVKRLLEEAKETDSLEPLINALSALNSSKKPLNKKEQRGWVTELILAYRRVSERVVGGCRGLDARYQKLEEQIAEYEGQTEKMQGEHNEEMKRLKGEYEKMVKGLEKDKEDLEDENERLKEELGVIKKDIGNFDRL